MMCSENDVARFCWETDDVQSLLSRFCVMIKNNPVFLKPVRGIDKNLEILFSAENFHLYPTYKKTTLLYNASTDCFIKILHPLTVKSKLLSYCMDKSESIYRLTDTLILKGIKVQKVLAYGEFKQGRRPFFVTRKAEGTSLYELIVKEKRQVTMDEYKAVLDEISKLHTAGFWFGDAHISHIFMKNSEVSGLVDMDSIRKNSPLRIKNLAKDIAGLNHPELPIPKEGKKSLLDYYMNKQKIRNHDRFSRLVREYTSRRWHDA